MRSPAVVKKKYEFFKNVKVIKIKEYNHIYMFEKLINTGKNLANIGLQTVSQVVQHSLGTDEIAEEEKTPRSSKKPDKPSVFAMKNNLLRQAELKGRDFLPDRLKKQREQTGTWIPALRFTAVGSGQTFDLRTLQQPAVLFISHKENAEIAAEWNSQLLGLYYPNQLPLFTANIILLDEIPLLAHPIVRRELRKAYDTIVDRWLKDPEVAARWIHILPDWDADSVHALHLPQRRPILAAVILSPQGRLTATVESPEPLPEIREILNTWVSI